MQGFLNVTGETMTGGTEATISGVPSPVGAGNLWSISGLLVAGGSPQGVRTVLVSTSSGSVAETMNLASELGTSVLVQGTLGVNLVNNLPIISARAATLPEFPEVLRQLGVTPEVLAAAARAVGLSPADVLTALVGFLGITTNGNGGM
ncbi:MAG: hypothetical protein ACM3XM_02180 [Mycobacterium leprae]